VSGAGVLFVVDPVRDQILRRLRDGRFAVLAGSGRRGFSGDGAPATKAALRLAGTSGVAVGAGGIVYFADTGNNRVRAVLANGRIETIAGEGRDTGIGASSPPLTGSRPARDVELDNPTGLAFGPHGELYIAAQDIVAVSHTGTVSYVAGRTGGSRRPASDELSDASGLAFDQRGDMFVSVFPSLFERTSRGQVRFSR
jgi:sugar lactone lactonase YvrE